VVKLCEANTKVLGKLDRVGILQEIGPEHYHADFNSALAKAVSHVEGTSTL